MSNMSASELYCFPCAQRFRSQYEFNQHIRDHLGNNYLSSYMRYAEPFVCKTCYKTFDEKSDFIIHKKVHYYQSLFNCRFCGKDCKSKSLLEIHTMTCSKNDSFAVVSYQNIKENVLMAHKASTKASACISSANVATYGNNSVHMTSNIVCTEDMGEYASPTRLVMPLKDVPVSYRKCFESKNEFQETGTYNLLKKIYVCEVCKESFTRRCVLDAHGLKHKVQQKEKEPVSYKYSTKILKTNFYGNILSSQKDSATINECITSSEVKGQDESDTDIATKSSDDSLCSSIRKYCRIGNTLKKTNTLNLQRESDTTEICKESSTSNCGPDIKKRTHGHKQLFQCDVCTKIFKDNYKLRRHYVMHTGEKPYVCLNCGKHFTRKDHLKRHSFICPKNMNIVNSSNIDTFACNVCEKTFRQKWNLKKHYTVHTGDRPHVCKICGKGFTQKYRLVKHASSCNGRNKIVSTEKKRLTPKNANN